PTIRPLPRHTLFPYTTLFRSMPGEVWAMTLDVKRTFDDVVARLAPDERALKEILTNPIYEELSSAVAGAQELSAVAKLYELSHEDRKSTRLNSSHLVISYAVF